jgi:hypothetical protein
MWTTHTCTRSLLRLAVAACVAAAPAAQTAADLEDVLSRVGGRIEEYFARAQSIVFLEKTYSDPIGRDFSRLGFGRVLEADVRVEWDPAATGDGGDSAEAKVVRELRLVNGRPPSPKDLKDHRSCHDPNPISPEPLAFLLPGRRGEYTFRFAGRGKGKEQHLLLVDFVVIEKGKPEISEVPGKSEDCLKIEIPGRFEGRLWIDAATYDVLRMDKRLATRVDYHVPFKMMVKRRMAESFAVERYTESIRYKAVEFRDPEEVLVLPESTDTLILSQGGGIQSYRDRQVFSNYRRFVTGGRLVK